VAAQSAAPSFFYTGHPRWAHMTKKTRHSQPSS